MKGYHINALYSEEEGVTLRTFQTFSIAPHL